MANDILEKGAIIQRDKQTYAIAPHIPGGFIHPAKLKKIAEVAEKYQAVVKLTSAQRMAIIGIKEGDIDNVWDELGMKPGAAKGLCVHSIKICPGTTFCKKGQQNSVGVGLMLDEKYLGMALPFKLKMGVSGCMNSCAESIIKDIGLMGTSKGFRVYAGGSSGASPRFGDLIAEDISDEEALELVDRIIIFYKKTNQKKRLGRIIDEIGLANFKTQVLSP